MKKNALIIYIAMIAVGMIMLFVYLNRPAEIPVVKHQDIAPSPSPQAPQEEIIRIAVAKRDLAAKTVLTPDDYQIKSLTIPKAGPEKAQYSMLYSSINDFALAEPIAEGAYISGNSLVEPGSTEYIAMFLAPGAVLYTFGIPSSDSYLFDNLKAGQGIDIYLSYGKKSGGDGTHEIVSPSPNIRDTRLQMLMQNKRILAMHSATSNTAVKKGGSAQDSANQIMVEMTSSEIKMLKGLEGKSQLLLFPAFSQQQEKKANGNQPGMETSWPVSDSVIFDSSPLHLELTERSINELRG